MKIKTIDIKIIGEDGCEIGEILIEDGNAIYRGKTETINEAIRAIRLSTPPYAMIDYPPSSDGNTLHPVA